MHDRPVWPGLHASRYLAPRYLGIRILIVFLISQCRHSSVHSSVHPAWDIFEYTGHTQLYKCTWFEWYGRTTTKYLVYTAVCTHTAILQYRVYTHVYTMVTKLVYKI